MLLTRWKKKHLRTIILYPIVRSTVENKVLITRWKKKHLLTIILYLIVCSTVKNKVLLVRGKKTISLTTMISKILLVVSFLSQCSYPTVCCCYLLCCSCVLFVVFPFLYLFSCLLINTRRCIHFDFYMITSYLVPVPFFKCHGVWYTTVRLFVNNTNVPVSKWIFLHFLYFVLSPFVFLINFVTHVSLYLLLKWSHSFFSFKRYLPACPES